MYVMLLVIYACSGDDGRRELPAVQDADSGKKILADTAGAFHGPCVVFANPGIAYMDSLRKTFKDQDAFETAADDWGNSVIDLHEYSGVMNIPVYETEKTQLHFFKNDGTVIALSVQRPDNPYVVYFFNGTEKPAMIDPSDDYEPLFEAIFHPGKKALGN